MNPLTTGWMHPPSRVIALEDILGRHDENEYIGLRIGQLGKTYICAGAISSDLCSNMSKKTSLQKGQGPFRSRLGTFNAQKNADGPVPEDT